MADPVLIEVPDICASSAVITMNTIVGTTSSPYTLQEQSFRWPGEQWIIDFRPPPTRRRDIAAQWQAFGLKAEGRFNRFLLGDPSARTPAGSASGNPVVSLNNQTGNALQTSGWDPNVSRIVRAGDYFQVGTGILSRLHMAVEDSNSDSLGNAVIHFYPQLRFSPNIGAQIIMQNPRGVFRMQQNSFSWSIDAGKVYRFSFQAVEVLNA